MPVTKHPKLTQPLWKDWDQKAQKSGQLHTVYSVNGDYYTGEWENNQKHGKGIQFWKGSGGMYDGDWEYNMRHGYGTYSLPDEKGILRKVYAGGWKEDRKHGYGTFFYSIDNFYEGEWVGGMRSGWGRMYYKDGTLYEGEWANDMRNGHGMYRLTNENRYEGEWKNDMKNGEGKFYHLDKGQIFIGTWKEDVAKCGVMEDFNRSVAVAATAFPLPKLTLKNPEAVLMDAKETIQQQM